MIAQTDAVLPNILGLCVSHVLVEEIQKLLKSSVQKSDHLQEEKTATVSQSFEALTTGILLTMYQTDAALLGAYWGGLVCRPHRRPARLNKYMH